MRLPEMLVVADEAEAAEIVSSYNSGAGPQDRWPALGLGSIGEEELSYLGIGLGVCDGADRDSVTDVILCGMPPKACVCSLIPEFIDALARLSDVEVRTIGREWRDADFRPCGGPTRVALLGRMVALARQARAAGKSLVLASPSYR